MIDDGRPARPAVTIALVGDVMTGRGIDQALAHPGDGRLHEDGVRDARDYLRLAESANGPIPYPVEPAYIWGDALEALGTEADVRIVNLETSITRADDYWRGKGIHYRMHPANLAALTAARPDVCVLANNHVLDYGYAGLRETLDTLHAAGVKTAGAGWTRAEAREPATVALPSGGTVAVLGLGAATSGIPASWAATGDRPGVHLLQDLSPETADEVGRRIRRLAQPGRLIVVSIHWGGNWGFEVDDEQVRFAHRLIEAGADIVHGHSSHHVRPIEVYRGRAILYGCGDFITDYEGIGGHESFRDDLVILYLTTLDGTTGALASLSMIPLRMRQFTLRRAALGDVRWLRATLDRISRAFGVHVVRAREERLTLEWRSSGS